MKQLLQTLFFFLLVTQICFAQWVQTNGPYCGGMVITFAVEGPTLFAGGGNSIFVSSNNGNTWTKVNTEPQEVHSLVYNGTSLFAGASNGVYRSTDNGSTWTLSGLGGRSVRPITMHGTTLLAGTNDAVFGQSIYRSTDGGTNWVNASVGLPQYITATGFSGNSENIFVSTWGQGVFRSTNDGLSWSAVNSSVGTSVFSILVYGTNLFAGTYGGVQRSTDNGTSWTQTSLTAWRIEALAGNGTSIFAGAYYDGVFLSTDSGTNWTQVNSGLAETNIRALAVKGSNLFVGTDLWGIFFSTNRGTNWTYVTTGEANARVHSLFADGYRVFAGTAPASVFMSTDNGTSWSLPSCGLVPWGSVSSIACRGNSIFAGLSWYVFPRQYGGSVFRSTDNGANWVECNSDMNESAVTCLLFEGGNLFVGRGGVFCSTDDGVSWIDCGLVNQRVQALASSNGNLFAGTSWGGGIFRSTNNGTVWSQSGLVGRNVQYLATVGDNILAGTSLPTAPSTDSLYLSTDIGATWTLVSTGIWGASITALAVSGRSVFAGTAGNGVFLSTDVGASWSSVNAGLTNTDVYSLAVSGTNLFAGTYGGGVWRRPLEEMVPVELTSFTVSANGKEVILNWSTATELNNQGFEVQRKFCSNDFVTIGSVIGHGTATTPNEYTYVDKLTAAGKYFYRLKQIDFDGKHEYSQTVEINWSPFTTYTLEQNFPNPFNPTTTIGFGIPASPNPSKGGAFVTLKVYDILGTEVKTLVNNEMEAGYHSIDFNASDLPSGVYFYQLLVSALQSKDGKAGSFVETKKMLLLR